MGEFTVLKSRIEGDLLIIDLPDPVLLDSGMYYRLIELDREKGIYKFQESGDGVAWRDFEVATWANSQWLEK